MAQVAAISNNDDETITFIPEDMLLKNDKHDRPLYYMGYIGSTCIERIQVDPRSSLSIISKRLLLPRHPSEQAVSHYHNYLWLQRLK